MNQATNRIHYGMLTPEERKHFDAKNNKAKHYLVFSYSSGWVPAEAIAFQDENAYRLKILPNVYYHVDGEVKLGSDLPIALGEFKNLRLATEGEIPVKAKTGDELINHLCWLWDDKEGRREIGLVKFYRKERIYPYYTLPNRDYSHAEELTPEELLKLPNFEGHEVKK